MIKFMGNIILAFTVIGYVDKKRMEITYHDVTTFKEAKEKFIKEFHNAIISNTTKRVDGIYD